MTGSIAAILILSWCQEGQPVDVEKLVKRLGLEGEKVEWAKQVGEKLDAEPELLSKAEKRALAKVILKEWKWKVFRTGQGGPDRFVPAPAILEAAWFYLEVLNFPERASNAAEALSQIAGRLKPETAARVVRALLARLEQKDRTDLRRTAFLVLMRATPRLKDKPRERMVETVVAATKGVNPELRASSVSGLAGIAEHLEGALLERAAMAVIERVHDKTLKVRIAAISALGRLAAHRLKENGDRRAWPGLGFVREPVPEDEIRFVRHYLKHVGAALDDATYGEKNEGIRKWLKAARRRLMEREEALR